MRTILALSMTLLSASVLAQANNCDCQQYTGTCEASISVVPTTSTSGSYGADLLIRATAPQCSKVDYYVDGTPYFTILSQGNQSEDRIFGQKPITRANISSISCRVCRQVGGSTSSDSARNVGISSRVTLFRPNGEAGSAVANEISIDGNEHRFTSSCAAFVEWRSCIASDQYLDIVSEESVSDMGQDRRSSTK